MAYEIHPTVYILQKILLQQNIDNVRVFIEIHFSDGTALKVWTNPRKIHDESRFLTINRSSYYSQKITIVSITELYQTKIRQDPFGRL